MATTDNLQSAFAGESQANRKYLAFAKKAEADGFAQVAKLFRAAADAETIHAHAHMRVLGWVKDTAANLQAAAEGEAYEFKKMYPEFLQMAKDEGNKPAEISFRNALAVEEVHHSLYQRAIEAVKAGHDLPAQALFVCPICGYTVGPAAPGKCPVCNTAGNRFAEVK
ncbi:MAG: rubrerythrin family protein [Chloroflexi bacterium]|nr:rubrerythrin family protein [Chloroflexota bacterium]